MMTCALMYLLTMNICPQIQLRKAASYVKVGVKWKGDYVKLDRENDFFFTGTLSLNKLESSNTKSSRKPLEGWVLESGESQSQPEATALYQREKLINIK